MNGPDFIVIVGRDTAIVCAQTQSSQHWLIKNMATETNRCVISRENVEEIVRFIQDSHWSVEVS